MTTPTPRAHLHDVAARRRAAPTTDEITDAIVAAMTAPTDRMNARQVAEALGVSSSNLYATYLTSDVRARIDQAQALRSATEEPGTALEQAQAFRARAAALEAAAAGTALEQAARLRAEADAIEAAAAQDTQP